jgi:hypothetical protein
MSGEPIDLAQMVKAMRPVVPARNFEVSTRFYVDLGFRPELLIAGRLIEMHLGAYSFMLIRSDGDDHRHAQRRRHDSAV